ncbi:integrase domain-containing protein [Thalassotalea maritima]|uniref:integrase domain-containing protein n=1 Tax=Thalassotalea maritima TaxID=3242416 RepID=UPI0035288355
MKKHNTHSGRNFGYGKQLAYAGKQALNDRFGDDGKYATKASHHARFKQFATWCKAIGIVDARYIDSQHIAAYCKELNEQINSGDKSISYAQNQISSVNVVLSTMRSDNKLTVSPSKVLSQRTHIRESVPLSLDRNQYQQALGKLQNDEAKAAVMLAREFGLRLREVALFRPGEAIKQVNQLGHINIQRGTKGGRTADRLITPNNRQLETLHFVQAVVGKDHCLVDKVGKLTTWRNQLYKEYRDSGAQALLGKFHDNRAAFACEVYKQLTSKDAPVVYGKRMADKQSDLMARKHCSQLLGHNRVDVMASYIGSAK